MAEIAIGKKRLPTARERIVQILTSARVVPARAMRALERDIAEPADIEFAAVHHFTSRKRLLDASP